MGPSLGEARTDDGDLPNETSYFRTISHLTSVTDPLGHTFRSLLDGAGRPVLRIDPQGRQIGWSTRP